MNGDLKKLYSDIIKSHNGSPYHFEKRTEAPLTLKAYNPVCGDRFDIFLNCTRERIEDLHFHGFGCAISKASTSILVKSLAGKSLKEALALCNNFLDFIDKKSGQRDLTLTDDFLAFSGVHEFPERYDCATLSWREMKKFLETKIEKV